MRHGARANNHRASTGHTAAASTGHTAAASTGGGTVRARPRHHLASACTLV